MFEGGVGSGPKRGELILHASVLTEEEAGRLHLPSGAAAWVLEHIFYSYDEKPISWGCFISSGELFSFRASVGAPAPDGGSGAKRRRR
jgi:DNA-binding GntR family transcriptional regulator